MNHRTYTTLFVLALGLTLVGWNSVRDTYRFASGSRVWVEGTSNVHDWSCNAEQLTGSLDASTSNAGLSGMSALSVNVPVAGLECGNRTMNGKLRDALGSSPIRFALSNARVGQPNSSGRFLVEADGRLTVHGSTQTQRVRAQGRRLANNRFQFTGETTLKMSDFGVDPPRALAGTLRTADQVTVKFDVTVAR